MLDKHDERRRFFRLRYKPSESPELLARTGSWRIVEISQGGARLIDCDSFPPGLAFVTIELPGGRHLETTASFLRHQGSEAVVVFDPLLPTSFVLEEQRRLIEARRGHVEAD